MQHATILDQYQHLGLMSFPMLDIFSSEVSQTHWAQLTNDSKCHLRGKFQPGWMKKFRQKVQNNETIDQKMPMKNRRRILLQIVWMNLLQSDNWRISFRDKKMLRFDHKEFFLQFQNATGYIRIAIWVLIEPNRSLLLSRLSRAINIFLYVETQDGAWRDSRIPLKQGDDWLGMQSLQTDESEWKPTVTRSWVQVL